MARKRSSRPFSVAHRAAVARDLAGAGKSPREIREALVRLGSPFAFDEAMDAILGNAFGPLKFKDEGLRLQNLDDTIDAINYGMNRDEGNAPFELDPEAVMVYATAKAISVDVFNGTKMIWVPISCIHKDSEIKGDSPVKACGKLVVQRWFARKCGYYVKED